jgi:SAM-dependent methyltransferase
MLFLSPFWVSAQNEQLAFNYIDAGEYEKAVTILEEVYSKNKLNAARMLLRGNHTQEDNCLVCGHLTSVFLDVDQVTYGHCTQCNHVQSSVRPTSVFLNTLYGSDNEESSSQDLAYVNISTSTTEARIYEIAEPKVEWVSNSIAFNLQDLWVDLGSGTGDTLMAAKKFGFDVLGIEISPTEISVAESRLLPTIPMFFDGSQNIPQIQTARVVSIFNVLEHALNPVDFLSSISRQMASGSYLVIEVPRLDGLSTVIQRSRPKTVYRHIFAPDHINIFSDISMDYCLSKLSFERVATWYFGSDALEVFSYVMNIVYPENSESLEKYTEEINLLQKQIDLIGASDVMLLIAKKK